MYVVDKLLSFFNYPDKSSLDPAIGFLKLFGMLSRGRTRTKAFICSVFLIFNTYYVISMCVNVFVNFTNELLFEFVVYTSFYLGVYETYTVVVLHKRWQETIDLMYEIERESCAERDTEHAAIVYKYKNYCQCVTYTIWSIYCPMLVFFFMFFWLNNVVLLGPDEQFKGVFPSAMPFDENVYRHWSALLQIIFGITVCMCVFSWDTMMLSSMLFFAGQLRALRARCAHALDCEDEKQGMKNIIICHKQYIAIRRCKNMFNSLLNYVTFPHILQVSIMIGVCIIKIVLTSGNKTEMIRTIDLLVGVNIQLYVYYSVANEIIIESERLAYGIFESKWVGASVRARRAVLMLGLGMNQRLVFTAGPFSEMSLSTLLSIWRATYSFYTLISK